MLLDAAYLPEVVLIQLSIEFHYGCSKGGTAFPYQVEKCVFLRALETGILNPQDHVVWTESVEAHCLPSLLVAYSGEVATSRRCRSET
ncbi:unnamed protein product [Caretta caretta]